MRNQSGDETVKSSEIFIKLQITECLLAISDWSGAEAFLNQNSEYSQLGNINYIKALQSYEDQNYESVQSHGQNLLGQIPENTWRWPLVKQRSDIELLLNKINRQSNEYSVDKLEEIGRIMILEEGSEWPCDLSRDGISVLHGSSVLRDSKVTSNKYATYKIRSRLGRVSNYWYSTVDSKEYLLIS